jgi:methylglutaconyl-CoA hydratase
VSHVLFEVINTVGYVTLNRPQVRNAFHPEMIKELTQLFTTLQSDAKLNVIVLRGAGASFCAGADLGWMQSMVDFTYEENLQDSKNLYAMFLSLWNLPQPLIVAAHGNVMGGALGLLAAADLVLAEAGTRFCFSEVRLGLVPAVISSFILKKSQRNLVELYMLSGEDFDCVVAERAGLVHQIYNSQNGPAGADGQQIALDSWIKRFLTNGPEATRASKKLLRDLDLPQNQKQTEALTTAAIATRRVSSEGQEGLRAFLEKREPSWRTKT